MTLPTLIVKYKIHELRVRFQRTNSIVNSALKYTLNDLGLSDYSDMNLFNLPLGSQASIYEPVYKEYNEVFEKQFKGAKKLGRQEILDNLHHKNIGTHPLFTKTFWGEPASWGHMYATSGNLTPTYYLLPDGALIGQIDAWGSCYASCIIATVFLIQMAHTKDQIVMVMTFFILMQELVGNQYLAVELMILMIILVFTGTH